MGEVDRETHLHGIALLNAAFSGIDIDHDQVAEDDLVSTRLIWRGVHTGEFKACPPLTGRSLCRGYRWNA